MAKTKKHNRKITQADRESAARLREIWNSESPRKTQAQVAELYGDNANQSLISQYIRGNLALGTEATLRFARIFNVPPTAIRPDFQEFQVHEDRGTYQALTPRHLRILQTFDALSEEHRQAWQAVGDTLAQQKPGTKVTENH